MNYTNIFWFIVYAFDVVLFIGTAITVIYMLVFAIACLFTKKFDIPRAKKQNRFVVIIPSYQGDDHIEKTVKSVLAQNYPQRLFDITVVSDHMDEMVNLRLAQYPITLLVPNFKYSTRAKSLQFAMANLPEFKIYDIVVILSHNTIVESDFLERVNEAYETAGTKAVQLHRASVRRETAVSNLSAIFEEINNNIFRQGHINMGLSSALNASGMAFDFTWFKNNVGKLRTAWDDKEMEALLLQQDIFIDYFKDIYVYDDRSRDLKTFNQQRGRFLSTQFYTLFKNVQYLVPALIRKRYDFVDKILQWILIPRTLLLAIIGFMSIVLPLIYMTLAIKWWIAGAVVMFAFALATPDYLVDEKWDKNFLMAPVMMFFGVLNIFKLSPGRHKYVNVNKKNNIYK